MFSRFLPAIVFFILSLVLLCLPGSTIPKYPWLALVHADKWVHIGMFGLLCLLFSRPVQHSQLPAAGKRKWFLLIAIAGISYGITMEFVQKYWVANRSFEIWDIAADSAGCLISYLWSRNRVV